MDLPRWLYLIAALVFTLAAFSCDRDISVMVGLSAIACWVVWALY